jgi:DMSO/TMAO reductase YedYZ molybdopterin-dependent catalytic subunit
MLVGRAYASDQHDPRNAAVLGLALGVCFTTCFVTGLLSHLSQHPTSWLSWPTRPAGLYRVTQGLHVATGIASIPLLAAKLWVVTTRFWSKPPVRDIAHAIERAMLFPLVGGSVFLLATGTLNTFQWYAWKFSFVPAHFWAAWITIGALIAHIGAKVTVTLDAVRRGDADRGELAGRASPADRRRFVGGVAAASTAITVATVGETVGWLHGVSVLAPRDPTVGPSGLPVNKTFRGARIHPDQVGADWRLRVHGRVDRPVELTIAQLRAMPQHEAVLPIACVEGWSASARWRGVRLREVLSHAGAHDGIDVRVESAQPRGGDRMSIVSSALAADPDTLLALEVNGDVLDMDHGYPLRLVAPARPGALQTKWITELVAIRP